jgi:hypothetical protein
LGPHEVDLASWSTHRIGRLAVVAIGERDKERPG